MLNFMVNLDIARSSDKRDTRMKMERSKVKYYEGNHEDKLKPTSVSNKF